MGNALSVPDDVPVPTEADLQYVHPVDPDLRAIGVNHGVVISNTAQTKLIVTEQINNMSGDNFKIQNLDGSSYGSNLHIKGKAFAARDHLVLMNGTTKKPICFAKSIFTIGCREEFRIYTCAPVFDGQKKAPSKFEGQYVYEYAVVERNFCKPAQLVHLAKNDEKCAYSIHRTGKVFENTRTVQKDGITCATMESGAWRTDANSYKLIINPGIDPCVMIMICVICDEMDENQGLNLTG
jgi:uncharacterized protein YxjI